MSINFRMLAIRPTATQKSRITELEKFLEDKDLMLLHKENHIYICDRSTGKELATASIL